MPDHRAPTPTAKTATEALVADRGSRRILVALANGRPLAASRIAAEAGLGAAPTRNRLAKLTAGGLLDVQVRGNYKYYRLAGPAVRELIESFDRTVTLEPTRPPRPGPRLQALLGARRCYDHLAGELGVKLLDVMVDMPDSADDVDASDPSARSESHLLSASGQRFVDEFAVTYPAHRTLIRLHVDAGDERPHLAGALGRGILHRLLELGWIRPNSGSRAVVITAIGRRKLAETLGIVVDS